MTSIAWSEYFTCIGAFSGRVQLRICRLRAYNSSAVPKRCDRGHFIFVTTKWSSIAIHQATAGQHLACLQREGSERCGIRCCFLFPTARKGPKRNVLFVSVIPWIIERLSIIHGYTSRERLSKKSARDNPERSYGIDLWDMINTLFLTL